MHLHSDSTLFTVLSILATKYVEVTIKNGLRHQYLG